MTPSSLAPAVQCLGMKRAGWPEIDVKWGCQEKRRGDIGKTAVHSPEVSTFLQLLV